MLKWMISVLIAMALLLCGYELMQGLLLEPDSTNRAILAAVCIIVGGSLAIFSFVRLARYAENPAAKGYQPPAINWTRTILFNVLRVGIFLAVIVFPRSRDNPVPFIAFALVVIVGIALFYGVRYGSAWYFSRAARRGDYRLAAWMSRFQPNQPAHAIALQRLQGNYEEALEMQTRLITRQPGNALLYNDRAMTYQQAGMYEEALQDFSVALKLMPDSPVLYNNRGFGYYKVGSLHAARQDYETALMRAKTPNDRSLISVNLAALWRQMGENDRALMYCQRAEDEARTLKDKNGIQIQILIERGQIALSMQQNDDAYDLFRQAYHLQPDTSNAMMFYALAQQMQGQSEIARMLWESLLKRNPLYNTPEWVTAFHGLTDAMQPALQALAGERAA